jgi:DNA ligase (NAD+)
MTLRLVVLWVANISSVEKLLESINKLFSVVFGKQAGGEMTFHPTDKCPECGSQLARETVGWGERPREPFGEFKGGSPGVSPHQTAAWHCPNPDCPPQVLKRVALWASPEAMDIPGIDAALVAQLVNRGLVRDAGEFYRLNIAELDGLEGMDEAKARVLWDAIAASKKREAWRVVFGLGIPHVGAEEAKALCKSFAALDEIFAAGKERLMKVASVSESTARHLAHWQGDRVNQKLVARLRKADVNFKC